MYKLFQIALVAFALAIFSACGKQNTSGNNAKKRTLRLYAGAGLRRGIDAIVTEFEKKSGIKVEVDYGGSGMIISRAREDSDADLFMPGDVWYVNRLQEMAGIIESQTEVAFFVPVIIVAKGNPLKIMTLKDFFRKDLKIALGNPKACQVGRLTVEIFKKNNLDISKLTPKESLTVNELGVWVKMHDADASVVWDAIAANTAKDIDSIPIPAEQNIISKIVIGLMTTSKDKKSAQKFIDFLISPEGKSILKSKGYRTELP